MDSPSSYFFDEHACLDADDFSGLAERVFPKVFRTDFSQPGFALIRLAEQIDSQSLRKVMVSLKGQLCDLFYSAFHQTLCYLSLGRFDQQVTTRFHLDGAPEVSFLMLGYEPSEVASELAMADFTHAARDLHITPTQFLDEYNPMFRKGEQTLEPYTTRLTHFSPAYPQILVINNSFQPPDGNSNQLGVMHQATILQPSREKTRVVNSTMLGLSEAAEREILPEQVEYFIGESIVQKH